MGNCPQQIRAELFLVCLHKLLFTLGNRLALALQRGCSSAGDQRNRQHSDKCQRIAGKREIKFKVRIRKKVIYSNHAEHCGDNTIQIAGSL